VARSLHIPAEREFDRRYGLEVLESEDGLVRGRVEVRSAIKQPMGLVHGGLYAAMAEALTSMSTLSAVADAGRVAVGRSHQLSFLRPIVEGHVNAVCRARHRGRTTWLWDVEIADDADRLCALVRTTIAVHPAPPGAR
jgi:1,4-dihydroxy-2-naphthoyl-CoA hydrolase